MHLHVARWLFLLLAFGPLGANAAAPSDPPASDNGEPPRVVLIKVGQQEITAKDFVEYFTKVSGGPKAATTHDGRRKLLREMIDRELLRQAMLQADLITEDTNWMMVSRTIPKLAALKFPVQPETDEQILRKFYDENKMLFADLPYVRLSQIFIEGPEWGSPIEREAARKRAEAIHARLEAGEPFGDLAAAETDAPGRRETKGDMGLFWRDTWKWLSDVLAGVKAGQYTGVLERPEGFHILMVTELVEPEPPEFERVRGNVVAFQRAHKEAEARAAYMRTLREQIPVVIVDDDLRQQYPDGLFDD